jgi:hypothetical protein
MLPNFDQLGGQNTLRITVKPWAMPVALQPEGWSSKPGLNLKSLPQNCYFGNFINYLPEIQIIKI